MTGIIIQARMGSNRLSGKVLMEISNKVMLEHICDKLKKLKSRVKIIVATSDLSQDDAIEEFCKKNKVDCFRGSEENVLERYYTCAKKYNFLHIVRLTADNPFVDIEELDNLLTLHLNKNAQYSHSFDSLPKGVGAEIFSFETLEHCYQNSYKPNHFEHVNELIQENPNDFNIAVLKVSKEKNCPKISLTVDTKYDYQKACFIYENSKQEFITTQEAIKLALEFEKEVD